MGDDGNISFAVCGTNSRMCTIFPKSIEKNEMDKMTKKNDKKLSGINHNLTMNIMDFISSFKFNASKLIW